ncbi:patatin-like phospholipase family protein, partial [bacterium]|nr:patatin-like phospholipase family protein [bacterium]
VKTNNIGIALSGGGIRAAIFHLGLFKWLAENEMLEAVRCISSVSGASLCVGMIYSQNNLKWPTSKEFLTTVLPSVEKILLSNDLQLSALSRLIISPSYWNKKVNIVAKSLESKWGVHGSLSDLEGDVMWYINCTTYETGKRFYFCREKMGDYKIGYVEKPNIPLSDVMAASSGFPVLIGPYSLKTDNYHWIPSEYSKSDWQPPHKTIYLWDGGVYDNLGLESIFKFDNGGYLKDGIDFMIVSNASASINFRRRQYSRADQNLKRILDISMDQVAALRSRAVMDFIKRTHQGMYIKIGNSAEKIALDSNCSEAIKKNLVEKCLSKEQANKAMNYKTTLKKPDSSSYQLLLQHGFETADCTYSCYQK